MKTKYIHIKEIKTFTFNFIMHIIGTDTHRKSPNVEQDSSLSDNSKSSPRDTSGSSRETSRSSSSPRYSAQVILV